ncbi:hypothetical protein NPX13_g9836 [Xylaria arbuscula]|uniref:Uncharacterized protein n=1 Tax=Xylaria arbuscula TaxID=114810 RepID=A0A9W8N5X7_9PEZI|nr:hypothetical protein NPX13_g9836 [Xylaria arbuscula]
MSASSKHHRWEARKLLETIRYDSRIASDDLYNCLESGEAFEEGKKARAAAMITNPRFEEFMAENLASSSLLINGRMDMASAEGISPLSYVAARLAKISETISSPSGSPYVVKYFCSQHPPFSDNSGMSPLVVLMSSLVGQLLSQMIDKKLDIDLSEMTRRDWHKIEQLDLKVLCNVFRHLTYQLPPNSVVLCIIDELAKYEIGPLMNDTDYVAKRLTRLVAGHDQIVIKFLVTCQGRALDIGKYFVNQTVDLVGEVEPDDSDSWRISVMGTTRTR